MSQTIEVNKKQEVDCPHCKGKFDLTVKQLKPEVEVQPQQKIIETKTETHEHFHEEKPVENDPHDEIARMLPRGVNFGKCANGNCAKKVKNAKGMTTKYKACPNCHTNTVPKSNDYCPTCGKDSEEWDDSDVEIETEEE